MSRPVIHWFRADLRLEDNSALSAAAATGGPVIPAFVLDDDSPGQWRPGGASRWWLHHSLTSLAAAIRSRGGELILLRGNARAELARLIDATGAAELYFTRCYEPHAAALEQRLHDELPTGVRRFGGNLLFEPERVSTRAGEPFRVFTPFWKTCLREPEPSAPRAAPENIRFFTGAIDTDRLGDWELLPRSPDWAAGLREGWKPGEEGAHAALQAFAEESVADYADQRDRPDVRGTSRLSPHLHFGELSPRQVWHAIRNELHLGGVARGAESFLRELGWREFSHHLLTHWPNLPEEPFRPEFRAFPWRRNANKLASWQRGETGYPLVDAGMRELWATGWMHNRVRMIAASFLVKHLLIPWQDGESWFWDTLVDADLANNSAGWQWVAGCGADAAPFFRIFNPVIQGKKFDPDGSYVRHWIPELRDLPTRYIHEPWSAPNDILSEAGIELGSDYPQPIVEHASARERALRAFRSLR